MVNLVEKDVIIELSKDFSEMEIKRFKKMLQQGGNLKLKVIRLKLFEKTTNIEIIKGR
jgi:hypothetical protein